METIKEKTKAFPFVDAYGRLPKADATVVRDVIMNRCKINSPQYFSLIKKGTRGVYKWQKQIIEATFKCYNIDARTGEYFN